MVNQQVLAHHWDEVRDQLCEKWNQLSEGDLPAFPGNVDQLIGRIQEKTGVNRETIEAYLSTLTEEGKGMAEDVKRRVQRGSAQVAQTARQGAEMARERLDDAEDMIRSHPTQAIIMAFGAGVACGLGIAMMLRTSRPTPRSRYRQGRDMLGDAFDRGRGLLGGAYDRGRHSFEHGQDMASRIGRQVRDSLAHFTSSR